MSEQARSLDEILGSTPTKLLSRIYIQLRNTRDNRRWVQEILGTLARQADFEASPTGSESIMLLVYAETRKELIRVAADILALLRQQLPGIAVEFNN